MSASVEAHGITYGESYRDRATGFEGVAVAVWGKWLGPTQVSLTKLQDGKVIEQWFDVKRLEPVAGTSDDFGFARANGHGEP